MRYHLIIKCYRRRRMLRGEMHFQGGKDGCGGVTTAYVRNTFQVAAGTLCRVVWASAADGAYRRKQMEHSRMHPMMIVAAASVTLVSLLGAASIAGILPNSQAKQNEALPLTATAASPAIAGMPGGVNDGTTGAPLTAAAPSGAFPVGAVQTGGTLAAAPLPASAAPAAPAPAPRRVVEHKTVVHHTYAQQPAPAPAPAAQNSPLGMGIGAVVGGLLGNQVGSGNGRKLATIAGAVGGAYAGNEIAKRNQQQ
jgi:uncharacterized protein YcfJ